MVLDPTAPSPEWDVAFEDQLTAAVEAAERGDHGEVRRIVAAHPARADAIRAHLRQLGVLGLMAQDEATRPEQIGAYRILDVLGSGGMGIVYLAEQKEPVRRRVALKVIKLGMDSKQVLARFQAERQALAMMNHDCIAKVFEAGTTERGQPYFAMEHVPGLPLHEHCDKHKLSIEERLKLFRKVCGGVQHAHQKGVIHRDLKPSNVLVTLAQGEPIPKIIDFGLARATDHRLVAATLYTEQGMVLGTPEYMSPEQAEMSSQDIDTRTDVYSLGVMLYELLVGQLPFSAQELRGAGLQEIHRKIREDEPPKPSTRLREAGQATTGVAERRRTNVAALERKLRGDLDWIVGRAMEKDRSRRYETAAALADDVGRHLANEPVLARPPSAAYLLRKLGKRYRRQLVSAGFVLAALVGGLGLAVYFWRTAEAQAVAAKRQEGIAQEQTRAADRARAGEAEKAAEALTQKERADQKAAEAQSERARAEEEREVAEAINRFLNFDLLGAIDPERAKGRDITVREILDLAAAKIRDAFADKPKIRARLNQTFGQAYFWLARYDQAIEHLEQALRLGEASADEQRLESAETLNALAWSYYQGRADAEHAVTLVRRALTIREQGLGPDDPKTMATRGDVATLEAYARGLRAPGLEEAHLRMIAFVRSKGETPEQVRAHIAERLISIEGMWAAGRVEEVLAIVHAEAAPALKVVVFGEKVPLGVSTLGLLYCWDNDLRHAGEALVIAALDMAREKLGPEHGTTLICHKNLAAVRERQGRHEEAETIYREILAISRRKWTARHRTTMFAVSNLAHNLTTLGKKGEAEALFCEARDTAREVLGPDQPDTIRITRSLARLLIDETKFPEAEKVLMEAWQAVEESGPQLKDERERTIQDLVHLYDRWEKAERAAEWRARLGG